MSGIAISLRFSATTRSRCCLTSLRYRLFSQQRTYALSRFPSRPVGPGRTRPDEPFNTESSGRISQEESPLWQASQSIAGGNGYSIEGLKRLVSNDLLVIERQIEMLNIFIGFEQTNKYAIRNAEGVPVGFIAEEPGGFLTSINRQLFATHRPFRALIMDTEGNPILWLRRPFAWINSRMYVQHPPDLQETAEDGTPVLDTLAEVQQVWHPLRRRYDLFLRENFKKRILSLASEPQPEPQPGSAVFNQFAKVDSPFLAWSFSLEDANGEEVAFISREWKGFGRELFTDTGEYYICFGPRSGLPSFGDGDSLQHRQTVLRNLSIDERALILALAVNIDCDYFSRHSGRHGGFFMLPGWDWE
ncbi:scramblase family protein [Moniliophthora roreri MCA 2997]|uniref:Phospholipid scramblase n=2 Tax=Moniliophthora roreri TaxID=221103 RepID=V2XJ32_MONRO|nr:scramblase family protein [Moniliophthora roreri MCA 2997]